MKFLLVICAMIATGGFIEPTLASASRVTKVRCELLGSKIKMSINSYKPQATIEGNGFRLDVKLENCYDNDESCAQRYLHLLLAKDSASTHLVYSFNVKEHFIPMQVINLTVGTTEEKVYCFTENHDEL